MNYAGRYTLLGSCFSENIGSWLAESQFQCVYNPMGISYNPVSIAQQLKLALGLEDLDMERVQLSQGLWVHPDFHSSFFASGREELQQVLERAIAQCRQALLDSEILFITFGSSIAFQSRSDLRVVNNCHKLPKAHFLQHKIDEAEAISALGSVFEKLLQLRPHLEIYTTVSPVRHLRHGAIDNQRSKARLLRLCEMLCESMQRLQYIPVYEFVMDELRDYRFYRHDDLIHLNDAGLQALRERLIQVLIDPAATETLRMVERLQKMKQHRLLHPTSEAAQEFEVQKEALQKDVERMLQRPWR